MKILRNYKSSLILIFSVIIGGIIGLIMGEKSKCFRTTRNNISKFNIYDTNTTCIL